MDWLFAITDQIALWVTQRAIDMNRFFHLHDLVLWLNQSPMRRWLNSISTTNLYAIPLVQWVHIMGIAVIVGSVVLMSLRMMGLLRFSPPLADMARRLLPWTWAAIAVNITTGILMVVDRPGRGIDNVAFPYKMMFLIFATVLSIFFAISLRRDPDYWEKSPRRRAAARAVGLVSVLLWVGVIVAGRWLFYSRIPNAALVARPA
jgi:hypothetical protein